jgi:UDP-3-O-[3-hydroxymyristoyl] glucosamine N-acyltransferase
MVCRDALDGKIKLPGLDPGIHGDAAIHESAEIEGPCFIGADAVVGKGAKMGAHSVIGTGARVGEYASIKRGVLWREAQLLSGAEAGCVLARGAVLVGECPWFENCVLVAGAAVGRAGDLMPAFRMPARRSRRHHPDANVSWAGQTKPQLSDGQMRTKGPM